MISGSYTEVLQTNTCLAQNENDKEFTFKKKLED